MEIAFFNGMYDDRWAAQPLYHANNIQGVGTCEFPQFTTLADKPLVEAQLKYVKKIASELMEFDNLIYDISDEPEMQKQDSWAWNSAMLDALISVDHYKHMYGETAHSASPDFTKDKRISWLPTEYISPMEATLDQDYTNGKPIIDVETAYYPSWYGTSGGRNPRRRMVRHAGRPCGADPPECRLLRFKPIGQRDQHRERDPAAEAGLDGFHAEPGFRQNGEVHRIQGQ